MLHLISHHQSALAVYQRKTDNLEIFCSPNLDLPTVISRLSLLYTACLALLSSMFISLSPLNESLHLNDLIGRIIREQLIFHVTRYSSLIGRQFSAGRGSNLSRHLQLSPFYYLAVLVRFSLANIVSVLAGIKE